MKRILLLAISVFSFFCCSSDDGNNLDPIIGKWYLYSANGVMSSSCQKQNSTEFLSNELVILESYFKTSQTPCHLADTHNGNWNKDQDGTYTLIIRSPLDPIIATLTFKDKNTLTIISGSPNVSINSVLKRL